MAGHHRADARLDCRSKRHKLELVQLLSIRLRNRQRKMRISARIAVPGEMLYRCQRAILFHAANERGQIVLIGHAHGAAEDRVIA